MDFNALTQPQLSGITAVNVGSTLGGVEILINSLNHPKQQEFYIQALVLPKITNPLPNTQIDRSKILFLSRISKLADPHFNYPADIDILVGSDYLGVMLLDDKIHDSANRSLYAQNTVYGWVIIGPIPNSQAPCISAMMTLCNTAELDKALQSFWKIEELEPTNTTHTPEKSACETYLASTHKRD